MLDNQLTDGQGADFLDFAERLVEERKTRMPFVVSMSGNPVSEQRALYERNHVDEFLQKPIRRSELAILMRTIANIA